MRFHATLAGCAGNRTLEAVYGRLVNELHLYRRQTLARGTDSFDISEREHAQIVDALAQRDADGAARLCTGTPWKAARACMPPSEVHCRPRPRGDRPAAGRRA